MQSLVTSTAELMEDAPNPRRNSRDVFARIRAPVSPPPPKSLKKRPGVQAHSTTEAAAVEAGAAVIDDHLEYFSQHLKKFDKLPHPQPHLTMSEYRNLFQRNQNQGGRHFVIHQHDHPVAGTHYDLRLQINHCSSVSWAIMYGLPGDPNSRRLNRNATETRIHSLWNHLIETASHSTGSILIWDTGEYEILPYKQESQGYQTEDEDDESTSSDGSTSDTEPQKLHEAFQRGKIRVRLHGTRLPRNYTLTIRLSTSNRLSRAITLRRPRKRRKAQVSTAKPEDSEDDAPQNGKIITNAHSDDEDNMNIQLNNAYAGSINTIGSIHQRTWYLSMDRISSGFSKSKSDGKVIWQPQGNDENIKGFESFYVRGRDVEGSVVTGRLAVEVLHDEGIEGYVGRNGWRAVLE